ncbi:MAG: ATP-binding protein [Bacteroidales bacterium]|jgi:predicted AAA+ superfamily ATPase|nr:ATP-binding protein [Bacteroidales bacterium]
MKLIERKNYLNKLISVKDTDVIKVVTGIRRCGKSTLFRMYINYLLEHEVKPENILTYNFEDFSMLPYLKNPEKLHTEIIAQTENSKKTYIFLDEVQNLENFERFIDSLHLRQNIDVYVTGSNSFLLSSELATLLTGRYIEIHILPFSFKEYIETTADHSRLDLLFAEYMYNGGFPGVCAMPDLMKKDYLRSIYNSIMEKDILVRNMWRKSENFDRLVRFMFDSIGSSLSAYSISKSFKNMGFNASPQTVETYIEAIRSSYLFYKTQRFNIKGKTILTTQEKYYAVDLGLKNMLLGQVANADMGHNLENIVYLELLRRGKTVNIGKANNAEIDFVCSNPGGDYEYIQVAWTAKEESTFQREIRPFELIKDYNKRILLTTDVEVVTSYKGIQKLNVIDWLLAE